MGDWTIECGRNDGSDDGDKAQMLFLGDVALAGKVGDVIRQHGAAFLFNRLSPGFFDADVVCYNLECCLSRRGKVWEPKPVPFRGLPEFLAVFPEMRGRYVANVANNHFLDYGEDAALDTLETLRHHNTAVMGAVGPDDAGRHVLLETRAGRIGLIAFAPSVHVLPLATRVNVIAARPCDMVSQVQTLKRQAHMVVVSLHQGVENTTCVDRRCRKLTHRLVEAGADCIVCHHPHIIQGIEVYRGAPIFHSIGNFAIDSDFARWPEARKSLALRLMVCGGRLRRVGIEPVVITDLLQPQPATDEQARIIRSETEALSSAFRSKLRSAVHSLRCEGIKAYDRVTSIHEMIRRQGTLATTRYYAARVMTRLK
ncbi:MAG: CapA family protein [Planctomycetes bacterium]|nr:CapA family protein [Planctomycetota bacterium]